jgi:SAM-dependent methyltransferase
MSNKFLHRSEASEMLDEPNIPKELLYKNLKELDFANQVLGGHQISLNGIKKLVNNKQKVYHIIDLGCGSGDILIHIARWARKNQFQVILTGVDRNFQTIQYLKHHCKAYPEINGIVCDFDDFFKTETKIDIVHSSLFCHHLNNKELSNLIVKIKNHAQTGFVINDLHRHWIAYYGVFLITFLLNGSKLSKNDGPISILRAFKKKELKSILVDTRINNYTIHWRWAFRYLVVGYLN